MRKCKKHQNIIMSNGGSSAMFVVIFMTLLSSLMITNIMSSTLSIGKISASELRKQTIKNSTLGINYLLSQNRQCTCNLRGLRFTSKPIKSNHEIKLQSLRHYDSLCKPKTTHIVPGYQYKGFLIDNIKLTNFKKTVDKTRYEADINLEYTYNNQTQSHTVKRVHFATDPTQRYIDTCELGMSGVPIKDFQVTESKAAVSGFIHGSQAMYKLQEIDLSKFPNSKYVHENSTCDAIGQNGKVNAIYAFYNDNTEILMQKGCFSHGSIIEGNVAPGYGNTRASARTFEIPKGATKLKYGFFFDSEGTHSGPRKGTIDMELWR